MKHLYIYILLITSVVLAGCYDRDILEKEGESIYPVTNITYTISEPEIEFTWILPTSYPDDIILPVSVYLTVYKDDIKVSSTTITDNPTTYTYTGYDTASNYRFIFKVKADVDIDDPNYSDIRYSEGNIVII